jgi:hypothetical protein
MLMGRDFINVKGHLPLLRLNRVGQR